MHPPIHAKNIGRYKIEKLPEGCIEIADSQAAEGEALHMCAGEGRDEMIRVLTEATDFIRTAPADLVAHAG